MKKTYLVLIIAMLIIGFTSVSTIIYINGKANIGANLEDYSIYFSKAFIDDEEKIDLISEDKQKITFTTKVLKNIGDFEKLEYDVTNASKQYDAKVSITCEPTENEYYEMEHVFNHDIIKARTYETGYITIKLKKVSAEEQDLGFTCTLKVDALEKTEINTSRVKTRCEYDNGHVWNFEYIGSEKIFEVPCDGTYKLEVWGAQGGSNYATGGYGGYSAGDINLDTNQNISVVVGGYSSSTSGGYNGGGSADVRENIKLYRAAGGGATHIAIVTGLLPSLKDAQNQILIIAGGGGGSAKYFASMNGGSGGGHQGGNPYYNNYKESSVHRSNNIGSSQSPNLPASNADSYEYSIDIGRGSFGKGNTSGGGGFYGGYTYGATNRVYSGAGGSGYIANPLLTNKAMYCYNCSQSQEESTKTISTNCTNATPTANCSKQGNGYAKITLVDVE